MTLAGTHPENVAFFLHKAGLRPVQQHRVGPYRLDFAFPPIKVDIEIDGWQQARPETAAKDAERDAYLHREGWLVFRVNDDADALVRVGRTVHMLFDDVHQTREIHGLRGTVTSQRIG
jgi:very-short-patch-repair endonuclease